jgi:hypothetical protein
MPSERQNIQIGDSSETIERIVRRRRVMLPYGMEVGFIEHRCDDIPVWRPINPVGLGLRATGWIDGVWRTIYRARADELPTRSQPNRGFVDHEIAGRVVSLPGLSLRLSPSLIRFLEQHIR